MKSTLILSTLLLFANCSFSQEWTDEQLEEANTAASVKYLTDAEKEVIQYINLCRLYPAEFADIEVKNYNGIPGIKDPSLKKYKASLLKDLAKREPCDVLEVDKALNDDAKCFSNELSRSNRVGHERKDCKERQYAECLAFGNQTAKQIVLEWLIDSGVASLGHRKNCLNSRFNKTGISIASHKEYGKCAVAEFWE
jgi:hypothetical protein